VAKAASVLDLYQDAQALAAQGEAVVCSNKTSTQARQRISATKAAAPGLPSTLQNDIKGWDSATVLGADGCCGADVYPDTQLQHMRRLQNFLLAFLQSALCTGLHVVYLILDNGSTHIPKH
jgi:hypothetical protein